MSDENRRKQQIKYLYYALRIDKVASLEGYTYHVRDLTDYQINEMYNKVKEERLNRRIKNAQTTNRRSS